MPLIHSDSKVFIIGNSKSGKTTLADMLSGGADFVSASEWVRNIAPCQTENQSKEEYIEFLGKFSVEQLQKDIDIAIKFMQNKLSNNLKLPKSNGNHFQIIEGIRNPRDFAHLYTKNDLVIFLYKQDNNFISEFEKSISIIQDHLE